MYRLLPVLALLLVVSCNRDIPADVVAEVNGDVLTVADLELMIPDYALLDSLQRSILVDQHQRPVR